MYKVFGKPSCPYCDMAKAALTREGLDYEYVDVSEDMTMRQKLIDEGLRTVPQIWHEGTHVGGYDNLLVYLKKFLSSQN